MVLGRQQHYEDCKALTLSWGVDLNDGGSGSVGLEGDSGRRAI